MSIIIDNNCTDVIFKGKQSDALHFGGTECWKKKKEAYLTTGKKFDNTINQKATVFTRSATPPSEAITVADISENNDKSIVTWYDEPTTTQYYYTDADTIYLNPDCSTMFMYCKIDALDLTQFDWSNVTNVTYMFGAYTGKSLDFNGISIPNITSMDYMFGEDGEGGNYISEKFNINLGGLDIPNVTCMTQLFKGARNVSVTLPTSATNLDTMKEMFSNAEYIDINWNNIDTSTVTDMSYMFAYSTSVSSGSSDTFIVPINTSNVTNMEAMFCNIGLLTTIKTIDISSFDLANVTNVQLMLSYIDLSYIDTPIEKIIYGEKFVLSQDVFNKCINYNEDNPTNEMFDSSYEINKPDWSSYGGNWAFGNDTYIQDGYITEGPKFYSAVNSDNATSFERKDNAIPADAIDISASGNRSILTWYDSTSKTQYYTSASDVLYLNPDCSSMFNWPNLTNIDLNIFKWDKVENMEYMFGGISNGFNLNFAKCNLQNVKSMDHVFCDINTYNTKVFEIDLSNNDMPNLENMKSAFSHVDYCDVKLPKSTTKLTDTSFMFEITNNINIDFGQFDTSHVTTMEQMFLSFGQEPKLDKFTPILNTSSVQNFCDMFNGIGDYVKTLDLSYLDISSATDMNGFIYQSYSIESIIYGDHFIPSNEFISRCTTSNSNKKHESYNPTFNMIQIDYDDKGTPLVPLPDWSALDGKWLTDGTFLLNSSGSLASGSVVNAAINRDATSFEYKWIDMYNLKDDAIDISANHDWSVVTWYDSTAKKQYYYHPNDAMTLNPDSSGMFADCTKLTSVKFIHADTKNVENIQNMFNGCSALTTISYGDGFILPDNLLNQYITADESNKSYMAFNQCPANKPTGGNWDNGYWKDDGTFVYKVVANNDIQGLMCYSGKTSFKRSLVPPSDEIINNAVEKECRPMDKNKLSATWPDPDPNINTQWWYCKADKVYLNPDSMGSFAGLETYKELDLSGFDFSDVTNMEAMFNYCKSLTNIIFPDDIDVSNVTTLRLMFEDCYSLVHLDLSKFHTTKAENFDEVFKNCTSLESLDLSGFDTSNVTTMCAMFCNCKKLSSITYGDKFILSDSLKDSQSGYPLAGIFEACPANKPNWTGGTWDEQDGSFVLTV